MDAYQAALAGQSLPRPMIGASRTKAGSIAALVVSYFASPVFLSLAPATQTTYRNILERFRVEHGDKPVALLTRQHINAKLANKVTTPAAANHWLRLVKALVAFAVEEKWRKDDPTVGIKRIKNRTDGFHTWTEAEIAHLKRPSDWHQGAAGAGDCCFSRRSDGPTGPHGSAARPRWCCSCSPAEDRRDAGDPVAPCPCRHHRSDAKRSPDVSHHQLRQAVHGAGLWEFVPRALQ